MTERRRSERERIEEVYGGYESAQLGRRKWSGENPGNRAIAAERHRALAERLGRLRLPDRPLILEIGTGSGGTLDEVTELVHGTGIGVDLLPERLRAARAHTPHAAFAVADGARLPFAATAFDVVVLSTVISSVLDDALARAVAREAARVLRPQGAVVWYDLRVDNPFNRNVRGITRRALAGLFPGFAIDDTSLTVLPPLVRRMPALYPLLAAVPVLRTHRLAILTRVRGAAPVQ